VTVPHPDAPAASTTLPPLGEVLARRYVHAGCTVLALAGEVDASCAPALRRHLTQAVDEGGAPVVVDLTDVTFIDLVAVGQLVQALARTGWVPGSIRLVAPRPFVQRVLELTRVTAVMPVRSTLADALAVPER
jgi:anti-sigma B factor antagonist